MALNLRARKAVLFVAALLAFSASTPGVNSAINEELTTPETLLASVATPVVFQSSLIAPGAESEITKTSVELWAEGNSGQFSVAPGGSLPSDAECAKRVTKVKESRPANNAANRTKGRANAPLSNWGRNAVPLAKRVSGNFTGTTDEIIQWASCKWGFDPEPVRAQVMVESGWRQGALGGYETNPAKCADPKLRRLRTSPTTTSPFSSPVVSQPDVHEIPTTTNPADQRTAVDRAHESTTSSTVANSTTSTTALPAVTTTTTVGPIYECPTAFGLMQVRSDYQPGTYPMSARSTAYNLDYSLAMKRACYEGVGWLGGQTRGNAWGCVGVHYSGQWLDPAAQSYIDRVKQVLATRSWE